MSIGGIGGGIDPRGATTPRAGSRSDRSAPAAGGNPDEMGAEDRARLDKLKARDAEVRAHEAAHASAAGSHGGAASYDYEQGPDGKRYAVGGEVHVQLQSGRTPDETIANAQQVRAAALAPAQPSSQDHAVASQAAAMEAKARSEKAEKDKGEAPDHDPALTMARLQAERRDSHGDRGHAHADDGCGFCSRAASAYR